MNELADKAAKALLGIEQLNEQASWVKADKERLTNLVRPELADARSVDGDQPRRSAVR